MLLKENLNRSNYKDLYVINNNGDIESHFNKEIDVVTEKGICYFMHRYLSFGDYDNSCQVERSNVRVFFERFKDSEYVKKITGWFGWEAIAVDVMCDNEEIIETLNSLDDYPAINDEDCSAMEQELIDEHWECSGKDDFMRLVKKEKQVDGIEETEEGKLREWFDRLCREANIEPVIESGGIVYFGLKKLELFIDEVPEGIELINY